MHSISFPSPIPLIILPLLIMASIGIAYGQLSLDFPGGVFQGCFYTCQAPTSSGTFFSSVLIGSVFAPLFQTSVTASGQVLPAPDIGSFFFNLGLAWNSMIFSAGFLTAVVSFVIGGIALFIAIGARVSGGASFLASGATFGLSFDPNTVKLMQSFGIGFLIWAFFTGLFGGWLNALGMGMGTLVSLILTAMYAYGLYWRGSSNV